MTYVDERHNSGLQYFAFFLVPKLVLVFCVPRLPKFQTSGSSHNDCQLYKNVTELLFDALYVDIMLCNHMGK